MLKEAAVFLLDCPPLEEIGGPITEVIEMYRYGSLEKTDAITKLVTNFNKFLQKYVEQSNLINEMYYQKF